MQRAQEFTSPPGSAAAVAANAAAIALNRTNRVWTWANAAARTSQSVSVSDIGAAGYQVDLALEYKLLGVSPARWAPLHDPSGSSAYRGVSPIPNSSGLTGTGSGLALITQSGTATGRAVTSGSRANAMPRLGHVTTAVAGQLAVARGATNQVHMVDRGIRFRTQFQLFAVSSSTRWFVGFSANALSTNVDLASGSLTNAFGVGRNGTEARIQLFHNDAGGLPSVVDFDPTAVLGATSATTTNVGWELDLYTPDGASWAYQLRNMETDVEVSGAVVSNLPSATALLYPHWYIGNNADASIVGMDLGPTEFWQRTR